MDVVQNLPSFDSKGNPLLYIVPPKPGDTIEYSSTIDKTGFTLNGITTLVDLLGVVIKVDKDYVVPMPIDGNIVGTNRSDGSFGVYWIFYTAPNGIRHSMDLSGYDIPTFLQDIPRINMDASSTDAVIEKACIPLKRGAPLLRTNKSTYVSYDSSFLTNLNLQPLAITDSSGLAKIPRVE